ncbi:serine/threonine protein phosphatase [Ensifer sp. NM-2]|uniref:metallophosphoesterase n=1 Tax=Ensifer sp. NM-2 TaxID=2109730 RepID=UPI000D11AA13|nr:metallophosphoesterase [Ensifer sp. NM-2]PSS60496.1 serine/threonine protein phosphatase [Ensifer sp. NM-2]
MLIAHISDFHVFSDKPETALVRLDAEKAARRVVADLARFTPALDAVAFTGDLTDGGSAADYDLLKDILSLLQCPVYVVPGNHDRRSALRAAFRDRLPLAETGYLNYETQIGFLRILALDTLIEGRGEGALVGESLDWLAEHLLRPFEGPTLVLLHHAPFPSGMAPLDRASLISGGQELGLILGAHRGAPIVLLAGHIHRPYRAMWSGTYAAVGGSPAFQVALNLAADEHEPGLVDEPYSYSVYRFQKDGSFAVHTRFVELD